MPLRALSPKVGPLGASAPSTLLEYLASVSKANWYALFTPGVNMTANSDGSGGAVALNGSVGCWAADQSLGWTAKFIQATSASRPQYVSTAYGNAVQGNGSSWSLALDSTTALNLDCTVLLSVITSSTLGYVFSHGGDAWSYYGPPGQTPMIYYNYDTELGEGLDQAQSRIKPSGGASYDRRRKLAISSGVSTSRYGNAARIIGGSGAYFSASKILQVGFVPKLSETECQNAIRFLLG